MTRPRSAVSVLLLVAAGCASPGGRTAPSEENAGGLSSERPGGVGFEAPFEVPFTLDEETRRHFTDRVPRAGSVEVRVRAVLNAIFEPNEGIGLKYRHDLTLSAVETFRAREGNCVSFVNLFIGASRSLGLPTFFIEVEDYETFRKDRSFVVNSTHLVAGYAVGPTVFTVDFLPGEKKRYRKYHRITDRQAVSLYYNNKAMEMLIAGRPVEARALLERVVRDEPRLARAWNNLGVCQGRLGNAAEAIGAFRRAAAADPAFVPARWNLAAAYRSAGELEKAQAELDVVRRLQAQNPVFGDARRLLETDAAGR